MEYNVRKNGVDFQFLFCLCSPVFLLHYVEKEQLGYFFDIYGCHFFTYIFVFI